MMILFLGGKNDTKNLEKTVKSIVDVLIKTKMF